MNIKLGGYFDRNLGDDLMQVILVSNMKDDNFYIEASNEEMLLHLKKYKNVFINSGSSAFDAYVSIIGTGFLYKGKRAILDKMLSNLKDKPFRENKTAVIDCSVEPPQNKAQALLIKKEVNKYKYISVRDDYSKAYIEKIAKGRVFCHEDIVFSLDDSYINNCDECGLGVIVVNRLFSRDNYEYLKKLAWVIDSFVEKTNKMVRIFAFDTGIENDTISVFSIMNMLKYPENAIPCLYTGDISRIICELNSCEKLITSRFHGAVLGVRLNKPTIAISDTHKLNILASKYSIPWLDKASFTTSEAVALIDSVKASPCFNEANISDAKGHIEDLIKYLKG